MELEGGVRGWRMELELELDLDLKTDSDVLSFCRRV